MVYDMCGDGGGEVGAGGGEGFADRSGVYVVLGVAKMGCCRERRLGLGLVFLSAILVLGVGFEVVARGVSRSSRTCRGVLLPPVGLVH